eukprot:TRINITY_DN24016_c0_g1_i1.p1 TRINITY_DN24016_c0_g1~~TRINITY_DN24016_c0_g1_i1.p1  ORF type:complete len:187 (+),score=26.76 TRINITY_DN24016_c0_g1_i1:25-561(+)
MYDIPPGRQAQQEMLRNEQMKYESLLKIKEEVNAEVERRLVGKTQQWEQEAEMAVVELQSIVNELEVAAAEDQQKHVTEVNNLASFISTAIQKGTDMGVQVPEILLKALEEASQLTVAPAMPCPQPMPVLPMSTPMPHLHGHAHGHGHNKRSQNIPVPLNGMGIGGTITPSDAETQGA